MDLKRTMTTKLTYVCLGFPCVELLWKVAREGNAAGELSCPNGVIFLDDSTAVVREMNNSRLQKFDSGSGSVGLLAEGKVTRAQIVLFNDSA